jgi:hypothetical protein
MEKQLLLRRRSNPAAILSHGEHCFLKGSFQNVWMLFVGNQQQQKKVLVLLSEPFSLQNFPCRFVAHTFKKGNPQIPVFMCFDGHVSARVDQKKTELVTFLLAIF